MSPELLSLILWIPFALTVIIAGLVHCISGYKRGLWRALISLGAVVVSTVISIFAARMLAKVLAPVVMNVLPLESAGAGTISGFITMIAESIVSMVMSIVLFGIVMFVISIILHIVSVSVKRDKLLATSKKMKFFGMGVGAVAAVMFACVWLSPIYGSIATVVPIAETVISMQESEGESDSFISQCINSVKAHPMVVVSESGPVSMVYSSISYFSVNNASVSIVDMSSAVKDVTNLFDEIKNVDEPEDIAPIAEELIRVMKDTIVEQGWFYSFAQEMIAEVKSYEEVEEILEDPIVSELFSIFEAPEDAFKENVIAILDFAQYALENNIVEFLGGGDVELLYSSGIIQEAGELANVSDESVKVKRLLFTVLISDAFDGALEKTKSFMDKYSLGKLEDPEDQLAEAEAILASLDGTIAEVLMRHPSFGEAAVRELFEEGDIAKLIGYKYYEEAVEDFLVKNSDGKEQIIAELKKCAEESIDSDKFEDAMDELLDIESYKAEFDYIMGSDSKVEISFSDGNGEYIIYDSDGENILGDYEVIVGEDGSFKIVGGDEDVTYDSVRVEGGKITIVK